MLVKIARTKWPICRLQRRAKALGGSLPARRGHARSAEQKSGGSEGQGRRGLLHGNWGLSREPTEKTSQNSRVGRSGPATLISNRLAPAFLRRTSPNLES